MKEKAKKTLLIFDFDKTILNDDSFGHIILNTLTKEELQIIYNNRNENWVNGYNYALKQLKSHGITKEKFNEMLNQISLTQGMSDLFNYIKEKKENYDSIILSSNYEYVIKYILNKNNIIDIFLDIITNPSREANQDEKEQFIYVLKKREHNCKICNPCSCKKNEFKEFRNTHDMNNYDKVIFICDGFNDFCLAVDLGENDITLMRKNFALYKKIKSKNFENNLKCKVQAWESGNDIINYLETI